MKKKAGQPRPKFGKGGGTVVRNKKKSMEFNKTDLVQLRNFQTLIDRLGEKSDAIDDYDIAEAAHAVNKAVSELLYQVRREIKAFKY